MTGTGIGQLRSIGTIDGKEIVERLEAIDDAKRFYRYTLIAGIPASHYTGMLEVKPKGSGSVAEVARGIPGQQSTRHRREDDGVETLLKTGLGSLKARFGAATLGPQPRCANDCVALDQPGPPRPTGRSPRSTWRARGAAPGPGSPETRASRELPRRWSITSVWRRNFSAIWTRSTVWMRSPRNSRAWTTRIGQRWFRPRSLRPRIASPMPETTSRAPRCWAARREDIERQTLAIDQACGVELEAVLAARRRIAAASGRLEDLVPLGAVLADLERFAEADAVYRQAFDAYDDVSPFPLAWVCFQLGMLWGELVPVPAPNRAALWYRRAMAYVPGYVKARVHLAEIYASQDQNRRRGGLCSCQRFPAGDPEVRWRLAEVLIAQGRFEEAESQLEAARSRFEELLGRHLLAFADHAAEFYAGSGNDRRRALELARVNVANRPTRRAVRLADAIAANMLLPGGQP